MTEAERERLAMYFLRGFRELQLADIKHSDENDVRMGTFTQCVAFIDALALTLTYRLKPPGQQRYNEHESWRLFIETYFPAKYAPLAGMYHELRNLLLHNFSAKNVGFTHDETWRHLKTENGRLILNRGSFVTATADAFEAFAKDVEENDELAARALRWLDGRSPIVYWARDKGASGADKSGSVHALPDGSASSASYAVKFTTLGASAMSGTGPADSGSDWKPSPDRPRAVPPRKKPKQRRH